MPDPTPGRSEHGPAPEHGPASEPGPVSEGSAPPPGTGSERAPNPGSPDTNAEEKSDTVPGNPPTVGSAGDARSRRRRRGSRGGRGRSTRRTVAGDDAAAADPGGRPPEADADAASRADPEPAGEQRAPRRRGRGGAPAVEPTATSGPPLEETASVPSGDGPEARQRRGQRSRGRERNGRPVGRYL